MSLVIALNAGVLILRNCCSYILSFVLDLFGIIGGNGIWSLVKYLLEHTPRKVCGFGFKKVTMSLTDKLLNSYHVVCPHSLV